MKRSPRELFFRLLLFIFGTAVTAVGGAVFVLCATGTDPFGVLMQGVARVTGLSNGAAHIAINAALVLVVLLVDRHYIHCGTFAALFCIGPVIDGVSFLLRGVITEALPYPMRLLIALCACLLIGWGLAFVLTADIGMGGNDTIAPLISDRLHLQFRWVRIGVDASFVLLGWLLGGLFGPGTIICVLLIGPVAQFCMPMPAWTLKRILQNPSA